MKAHRAPEFYDLSDQSTVVMTNGLEITSGDVAVQPEVAPDADVGAIFCQFQGADPSAV